MDIVIGTHRLLQKDVTFKNLGLVIIDEEQRFGVSPQGEAQKAPDPGRCPDPDGHPHPPDAASVPRRHPGLSIINTPPEDRLPVKTHVLEFDEGGDRRCDPAGAQPRRPGLLPP